MRKHTKKNWRGERLTSANQPATLDDKLKQIVRSSVSDLSVMAKELLKNDTLQKKRPHISK